MTQAASITAWFEDAATRHPSILHDATDARKLRFFELEWDEMLQSGAKLAAPSWVLLLEEYTEQPRDNGGDYISMITTLAFSVGKTVGQGKLAEKKEAFHDAKVICYDILGKMRSDELAACDADVPAGVHYPRMVDVNSVRVQPLKLPYLDSAYGARMTVKWRLDKEITLDNTRVEWVSLA